MIKILTENLKLLKDERGPGLIVSNSIYKSTAQDNCYIRSKPKVLTTIRKYKNETEYHSCGTDNL